MRRLRIALLFPLFADFLAASACSDAIGVEERLQQAFGGPLQFYVFEDYASPAPGLPEIRVVVETIGIFAVSATLEGESTLVGRTLTMRPAVVANRSCPMPCVSAGKQPKLVAKLPRENGEYTLRFEVVGATLEYRLTVAEDAIRISPDPSQTRSAALGPRITPMLTFAPRIRTRSFLLACSGVTSECIRLTDRIVREVPAVEEKIPHEALPWFHGTFYRYADDADFAKAPAIACEFMRADATELGVTLINWDGVTARASRSRLGVVTCG